MEGLDLDKLASNKKFEVRLNKLITENKPKTIKIDGKKIYFSRKILNLVRENLANQGQLKAHEGGIIPIMAIIAAIAAAGSVAGGVAGAVDASNKAAHQKVLENQDKDFKGKQLEIMNNLKSSAPIINGSGVISDTLSNAGSKLGHVIENSPQAIKSLGQHIIKGVKQPLKKVFSDLSNYFDISGGAAEGSGFYITLTPKLGSGIFSNPRQDKGFHQDLINSDIDATKKSKFPRFVPSQVEASNPSGSGLYIPTIGRGLMIPKD